MNDPHALLDQAIKALTDLLACARAEEKDALLGSHQKALARGKVMAYKRALALLGKEPE